MQLRAGFHFCDLRGISCCQTSSTLKYVLVVFVFVYSLCETEREIFHLCVGFSSACHSRAAAGHGLEQATGSSLELQPGVRVGGTELELSSPSSSRKHISKKLALGAEPGLKCWHCHSHLSHHARCYFQCVIKKKIPFLVLFSKRLS